jgi:regulator of sigma D
VRLETLGLDEMSRVWEALEGSYQLAVSYEVAVVNIDSALEPDSVVAVQEVLADVGQIVGAP